MEKLIFEKEVNEDMPLEVTELVESYLETNLGVNDTKLIYQFNIAIDELCSNLLHYSGAHMIWVKCSIEDEFVSLVLKDDGKSFNLLESKNPDESDLADDAIGGYGIFMVKQMMDEVDYQYVDDKNIVTLTKKI